MRRDITLWIDGQRADINDDTLIQFNYLQTNLDNPTVVRNSYSLSVVLPATPNNNRIFGSYYRLDRISNPYNFGPQFDAMRRTPFAIYDAKQNVLEKGYLRLEEVKRENGGVYSYTITLYGGLGGFFYKLTSKDDGTAVNLGDLTYTSYNGAVVIRPNDATQKITLSAEVVADCMHNVGAVPSSVAPFRWFLSFAPCYNGIPESGFDAKKAYIRRADFYDCGSDGYAIVTMTNGRTEWEVRDLRAWLQRPVVNVLEIIKAISVEGYTFTYSQGVTDALTGVWITLKQMSGEHVHEMAGAARRYAFSALFEDSPAPAALLTSLAKQFGFVFECDKLGNVTMETRAEMYARGTAIDISSRIDWSSDVVTRPYAFDAKYYVFKNDVSESAFAKEYQDRYGKTFGQQLVNTAYEFSDEQKDVIENSVLKGCVMNALSNFLFRQDYSGIWNFMPAFVEKCTIPIPAALGGGTHEIVPAPTYTQYFMNTAYPYYDKIEKPDFQDSSRKAVDGANVLLYYIGQAQATPAGNQWRLYISDDVYAEDGITAIWDMTGDGRSAYYLPIFSRYRDGRSLDFGYPLEQSVPWSDTNDFEPIYEKYWSAYFNDRMSKDTKVVRCSVDLRGIEVGQHLLCNTYFFGGAIWVLSKIENYLVGGDGVTQCEFIKIQDKNNYVE